METLLAEKEWIGEFFLPDQFENRFLGKVSFSPGEGVVLSYTIVGNDLTKNSELLYGVLTTGEKCTMVGPFLPDNAGVTFKNGMV